MKEITGKARQKKNNLPKSLTVNGKYFTDKKAIGNHFNDFFSNIGSKLSAQIGTTDKDFSYYLKECPFELRHDELTFEEFETAFQSISRNKASGYDDISGNIILECYDVIKNYLFKIARTSLEDGIFPSQMKIAKVFPIFKGGNPEVMGNYRPISVLPVISKVLEKIMYNRIYSYLKQHNLLYEKQFGFQKNTSTEHAILGLVESINKAFTNKKVTLGVFIDLSKAFDTANHEILLEKLQHYGIKGHTLKWLKSYITNRKQCICIENGSFTDLTDVICGVPQGSI